MRSWVRCVVVAGLLAGGGRSVASTNQSTGIDSSEMDREEAMRRRAGEEHARRLIEQAVQAQKTRNDLKAIELLEHAIEYIGEHEQSTPDRERATKLLGESYYRRAQAFFKAREMDAAIGAASMARRHGHRKARKLIERIKKAGSIR